ncbi:MAG: 16S rRNA (adenine(1518)-N(6)/adenine(1519)-N(6))-dimethyltransferase RsmA [bacterium]
MGQRLGQHFLRDDRVLEDIVAAAQLKPGQRILEIGPGPGNLTARLAAAAGSSGEVVAIEADRELATALEGKWPNVHVVAGDAVREDLAALGRFHRIVANLPYLISGPITIAFLELLAKPATRWDLAVLMYQREFAERLLAHPSSHDYGRLTVQAARWCRVTPVRDVAPGAFNPPPRVDSMVVALQPHATPPFAVDDERVWQAVLDGTFQRRRKQLRNSLPAAVGGIGIPQDHTLATLDNLGWTTRRPENLSPREFAELGNALGRAAR